MFREPSLPGLVGPSLRVQAGLERAGRSKLGVREGCNLYGLIRAGTAPGAGSALGDLESADARKSDLLTAACGGGDHVEHAFSESPGKVFVRSCSAARRSTRFGFVASDDGGKDLFVHRSALERSGARDLPEGMRVRVKIVEGQKGPEVAEIEPE
jgi:cold shock CspA family protein